MFYDWEPTEAITALERLKRKTFVGSFHIIELQQERKLGDGAKFIDWLLVDEKFCRELKACARCVFIVERSSALRVARFKVL